MTPSELQDVLERATVPEHSAGFMGAMSGGEPFLVGPYVFIAAEDWLLAVGYPLVGDEGDQSFNEAIREALKRTGAKDCWAVSTSLPHRLKAHLREEDHYFVVPVDLAIPRRLEGLAARAARSLRVEEGTTFTAAHRRLWAEFTSRTMLPPNVRELYARTEHVLPRAPGLVLLNAWDHDGHLAACLLLDTAPRRFLSYLLGAHSRIHRTPYASDLLFHRMILLARQQGKEFIHLGLGVNDGIRRFKTKWGGKPGMPYEMAAWQEKHGTRADVAGLMKAFASMPDPSLSKQQFLAALPKQRRFAMAWEVEKDGRRSWLAGTAHFFCYSFEYSLRELLDGVDTALFEGPLDRGSLDRVSARGRSPEPHGPRLADLLDEEDILRLEKVVCGPRWALARWLGLTSPNPPDVRGILSETRPWMAFFSLWTSFLERNDWTRSVDLEAWHLAHEMGKTVRGMETIEEQIETLETVPMSRIVNFFRQCHRWKGYIKRNARAYLKGDLDAMMGTSIEFPSRTEAVINHRDIRFFERMQPAIAEGRCAVFVGSAHIFNLRRMLSEDGFAVRKHR